MEVVEAAGTKYRIPIGEHIRLAFCFAMETPAVIWTATGFWVIRIHINFATPLIQRLIYSKMFTRKLLGAICDGFAVTPLSTHLGLLGGTIEQGDRR